MGFLIKASPKLTSVRTLLEPTQPDQWQTYDENTRLRWCSASASGRSSAPAGEPQFNGDDKNFNGWFQPRLFDRRYTRPGDLRRELARLQEAVNTQHVHPRLRDQTPAQPAEGCGCGSCPRASVVPTGRQKLAVGRVTFIRRVSPAGTVDRGSASLYRVGKSDIGACTCGWWQTPGRGWLAAALIGRVPEALALQTPERLTDT